MSALNTKSPKWPDMNLTCAPLNTKSLSVSLRECFLFVAILGGVSVTAITEVLSTFTLITYGWLVAFWSVVLLGSASFVITLMRRQKSCRPLSFTYVAFSRSSVLVRPGLNRYPDRPSGVLIGSKCFGFNGLSYEPRR